MWLFFELLPLLVEISFSYSLLGFFVFPLISEEIQNSKVGAVLKVMVDREDADYFIGRTEWDSPEVDPEVLIVKEPGIKRGEFCKVKITEALPFELIGIKE